MLLSIIGNITSHCISTPFLSTCLSAAILDSRPVPGAIMGVLPWREECPCVAGGGQQDKHEREKATR
jgi:hypothetical protein